MEFFQWAGDGLASEDEVRELMSPYSEAISNCWYGAWQEWTNLPVDSTAKVGAMQRGGVIHEFALDRAKEYFASADGVEICPKGFWKIYIDDRVVVRFLKLNSIGAVSLRGKRVQTRRYYNDWGMSNVRRHCTRLTAGYRLNATETAILDVSILLQLKESVIWSFRVDDHGYVFEMPQPPAAELPSAIVTLSDESDDQSKGVAK